MDFSCQSTFIVYLTDGLPTQDTEDNAAIEALPRFRRGTAPFPSWRDGSCRWIARQQGPSDSADGACMVNLAGYMHHHDMSAALGAQTVTTYVVGFGSDISESAEYLDDIAEAGGGEAYTQGDSAGLRAALEEIFAQVRANANTTFVSPTVAVNAFNRTRNLNQLYISVFAPTNRAHWPGNLKKYELVNGVVHGATGAGRGPCRRASSPMAPRTCSTAAAADGAECEAWWRGIEAARTGTREMSIRYLGSSANLTDAVESLQCRQCRRAGTTCWAWCPMPPIAPMSSNSRSDMT